jgi:hypothetical protein
LFMFSRIGGASIATLTPFSSRLGLHIA